MESLANTIMSMFEPREEKRKPAHEDEVDEYIARLKASPSPVGAENPCPFEAMRLR